MTIRNSLLYAIHCIAQREITIVMRLLFGTTYHPRMMTKLFCVTFTVIIENIVCYVYCGKTSTNNTKFCSLSYPMSHGTYPIESSCIPHYKVSSVVSFVAIPFVVVSHHITSHCVHPSMLFPFPNRASSNS